MRVICFTGANLKAANFDNSQMNGVNLRLASLRGSSLRSCNLRYAIMAGTDMEVRMRCITHTACDSGHSQLWGVSWGHKEYWLSWYFTMNLTVDVWSAGQWLAACKFERSQYQGHQFTGHCYLAKPRFRSPSHPVCLCQYLPQAKKIWYGLFWLLLKCGQLAALQVYCVTETFHHRSS